MDTTLYNWGGYIAETSVGSQGEKGNDSEIGSLPSTHLVADVVRSAELVLIFDVTVIFYVSWTYPKNKMLSIRNCPDLRSSPLTTTWSSFSDTAAVPVCSVVWMVGCWLFCLWKGWLVLVVWLIVSLVALELVSCCLEKGRWRSEMSPRLSHSIHSRLD